MNAVSFPEGFHLESLKRTHPRKVFRSGEPAVDDWLATKAFQHQQKHLSVTKALRDDRGAIAGFYTLATGQVDFGDLPADVTRKLPRRVLPVAVLAWLGIAGEHQKHGLGARLLAQALRDCYDAGQTFAFVAVILDCLNDNAREFYRHWQFDELPGHPYRLFLSANRLASMMSH